MLSFVTLTLQARMRANMESDEAQQRYITACAWLLLVVYARRYRRISLHADNDNQGHSQA